MTDEDKVILLIIFGLALSAYACVPRGNAFPTTGARLRWGLLFFLVFLAASIAFSWEKVSALWISS